MRISNVSNVGRKVLVSVLLVRHVLRVQINAWNNARLTVQMDTIKSVKHVSIKLKHVFGVSNVVD